MNIVPRGMSVMEFYRLYRTNRLLVNRGYQRKLVWTKTEKQSLVDSVLQQYPIPLILLAEINTPDEPSGTKYEIIDGMQRLNALFGFIENEFAIEEGYFDVKHHPLANQLSLDGVFQSANELGTPHVDAKSCASFLEYQLPVSTFQGSQKNVNDVFGRINSNGKHLSPQEVRQAGVTTVFSSVVRELSSTLRGDISENILPLSNMPEISIDSRNSRLRYGVMAEDTFWCDQGIIRVSQLRESEDEQIIADIVVSILRGEPFAASKEAFDECYGKGDSDKRQIELETLLQQYGHENITYEVKLIFDKIRTIVGHEGNERNYLRNVLNPRARGNSVKEPFYTMFMAFHQLIVKDEKEPFDYPRIFNALDNLASKIKSASKYIVSSNRKKNIDLTVGLIQGYFKDSDRPIRSMGTLAIDFENYLRLSKIEAPRYDFKQGFLTLVESKRKFDESSFEKILYNITALANIGRGKTGYLFIGVTDKEQDSRRVEQIDQITAVRVGDFGVVGLEREARARGVSLDQYVSFIINKIRESQLPEPLRSNVSTNMIPLTYHDKTVLMFEVTGGDRPAWYGNTLYVRDGASCRTVPQGPELDAVYSRFSN